MPPSEEPPRSVSAKGHGELSKEQKERITVLVQDNLTLQKTRFKMKTRYLMLQEHNAWLRRSTVIPRHLHSFETVVHKDNNGPLFRKTVADSNAPVQEKALDALIAFLKAADADAGRYAKEICDSIVTKCLTGRPKTVEKAQAAFLLWVELEATEVFLENFVQICDFDFDLGAEGDLFKAPEPIIEEPLLALDPLTAAMTNISNGQDVMTETIKAADMESMQNEQLNDVLYDCKKELLAKYAISEMLNEVPTVELEIQEAPIMWNIKSDVERHLHKSVSTGFLNYMDWVGNNCSDMPNFLDFQFVDFETAFGIRRAFSEGDIQDLEYRHADKASMSHSHSQMLGLPIVPATVSARLDSMKELFDRTGKCGLCEVPSKDIFISESSH